MANRTDFLRVPIESCRVLTTVAKTGGVEAGEMDDLPAAELLVGVYAEEQDAGDSVAFIYNAEGILVPKQTGTGTALAIGALVYYDAAEGGVNGDPTGNTLCGIVRVAAATTDATVEIDLDGMLAN